jgi:hypothetical protein
MFFSPALYIKLKRGECLTIIGTEGGRLKTMKPDFSRRDFLTAGLVLPAAGLRTSNNLPLGQALGQARPESVELTYRTLGKTGLKVTSLAFGCMTTPDPSVIKRAADFGINHFDTARAYQNGNNERMVGVALKDVRQRVIISSKSLARTKTQILADLDTSLRELGTDYLDIWYLHMKNEPEQVNADLLEAQQIAKQSGKIRFAGGQHPFQYGQNAGLPGKAGPDRCRADHIQFCHAIGGRSHE